MEAWLMRRQKLLAHLKNQVALHLGPIDKELEVYRASYIQEFEGEWEPCDRSQMLEDLRSVSIILGGDFHAFPQSQRAHLRIMRDLDKPFTLALECLEGCYQDKLDRYILGEYSTEAFLSAVGWSENWGFPWSYYQPLIDFAREKSIPVFAVNKSFFGGETLSSRDEEMAKTIVKRSLEANRPLYVIVGEYHLARKHLPQKIYDLQGVWPRVICQDSEKLYFKWAKGLAQDFIKEPIECMRSSEGSFCVFTSPPWVKWQNYLIYLEKTHDEYLDAEGDELMESVDYTGSVLSLIDFLARDLGVKTDVSDLSVYSSVNQDYVDDFLSDKLSSDQLEVIRWKMSNDRSFCVPDEGIIYLSRGTTNHAATVAGQYLHGQIAAWKGVLCDFPRDFIPSIWIEGMSYFMSKIVNYRRKTESVGDIRAILATSQPEDKGYEALKLSLAQRMREVLAKDLDDLKSVTFQPKSKMSYIESSRILGQMLGERLYAKYRSGDLGRSELRKLLREDIRSQSFLEKYLILQTKLNLKSGGAEKEDFI